jgi:hypothetical protein
VYIVPSAAPPRNASAGTHRSRPPRPRGRHGRPTSRPPPKGEHLQDVPRNGPRRREDPDPPPGGLGVLGSHVGVPGVWSRTRPRVGKTIPPPCPDRQPASRAVMTPFRMTDAAREIVVPHLDRQGTAGWPARACGRCRPRRCRWPRRAPRNPSLRTIAGTLLGALDLGPPASDPQALDPRSKKQGTGRRR